MLFLVDEDVPLSAADLLAARGHRLCPVTEVLLPGSPDALIARWAEERELESERSRHGTDQRVLIEIRDTTVRILR